MSLRPSSCCLLHDRPINQEVSHLGKNDDFIWKASRLRRWWTRELCCLGLDATLFYRTNQGRYQEVMEKAMATHSSTLAWKIPWTEEPGRLQSLWSWRIGHDWATSLSVFTFMHWRRKWQPTPVFLPGESQGWQSLVGCRLWGRTELDTTEAT